jgi:hypothetical protein
MNSESKPDERFTMLEPKEPNAVPPGAENWPVVEFVEKQRFTMLEPKGPNNPTPEEEAVRVVDLACDQHFTMLPSEGANVPLPSAVVSLAAQLADALAGLDAGARAAALAYLTAEVGKRQAG